MKVQAGCEKGWTFMSGFREDVDRKGGGVGAGLRL